MTSRTIQIRDKKHSIPTFVGLFCHGKIPKSNIRILSLCQKSFLSFSLGGITFRRQYRLFIWSVDRAAQSNLYQRTRIGIESSLRNCVLWVRLPPLVPMCECRLKVNRPAWDGVLGVRFAPLAPCHSSLAVKSRLAKAVSRVRFPSMAPLWRVGRAAEGTSLENWRAQQPRGFESHTLFHICSYNSMVEQRTLNPFITVRICVGVPICLVSLTDRIHGYEP